ncbi:MAG: hypothetical protein ACXW30_07120 [Micavibrio sp.]
MKIRVALVCAALVLSLGCGNALAQEKKSPTVFNSSSSNGEDVAPVFVKKRGSDPQGMIGGILHKPNAYGMQTHSNSNNPSSPENVKKARIAFEEATRKQNEINDKIRDSRLAKVRAEFDAKVAQDYAAAEARKKQEMAAAGIPPGTVVMQPGMSMPPSEPYAGSNVVFTGKKKTDEDKPTRLFNTR